jgi:hypothetical protein
MAAIAASQARIAAIASVEGADLAHRQLALTGAPRRD